MKINSCRNLQFNVSKYSSSFYHNIVYFVLLLDTNSLSTQLPTQSVNHVMARKAAAKNLL